MAFTFKTEQPTGRYRSFYPTMHHIKLNKGIVGSINDKDFTIKLHIVKDGSLKWITLTHKSKSLLDAKQFLKDNFDAISKRFELKQPTNI